MDLKDEIAEELEKNNLSAEQVAIFNDYCSRKYTYDEIKRRFYFWEIILIVAIFH